MLRPKQVSRILKRLDSPKHTEAWLKRQFPIRVWHNGIGYYSYDDIWAIIAYCRAIKLIQLESTPRMDMIAEFCEQALTFNKPFAHHIGKDGEVFASEIRGT